VLMMTQEPLHATLSLVRSVDGPESDGEDGEERREDASPRLRLRRQVKFAVRASLLSTALLTSIWVAAFLTTASYAFLAALGDSIADLLNQVRPECSSTNLYRVHGLRPQPGIGPGQGLG
jgi:hypothetical protein